MEINFDCKFEQLMKQLPKEAACQALVTALLAIQEQTKPSADFLPIPLLVKLYSKRLSAILEANCKEIFSEETMKILNKEFKNGFN